MTEAKVTVVCENSVRRHGLLGEHGLAVWIELPGGKVLFDTGQGLALTRNVRTLGVQLSEATALVLSHGHYDHTGGLGNALCAMRCGRVFAHSDVFRPKYGRNPDGTSRKLGLSRVNLQAAGGCAAPVITDVPTEVCPGLHVTGPIPRVTAFEDTGGAFFLDPECRQPDLLMDDQAAFFDTAAGTVVVLGCAHAGVINTLHYIRELTHGRPMHTVIGGMHLVNADQERLDRTIAELRRFSIQQLLPCHCTGVEATVRLWQEFPGRCQPCCAGTVLSFLL
jgi:7,8-dihydropterin-6-yl-methyl-4-(beta-D-ribofuranosyl)aminobenzene 5'-phosphate synthase